MKNLVKRYFYRVRINSVIQFLTYSDILMMSGWGLVSPIIAVFFTDNIIGGNVVLAGLASTVYLLTKSILQVPVARYIDIRKGEKDDYRVMITGSSIIALSAFLFAFVSLPWHVILVQMLYGVGGALSFPSWQAIFTRHIDRSEEGLEWSLYFTATDLGGALTAGLGGFLAAAFGYRMLFVLVGILSVLGTLFLAGVTPKLRKR